MLEIVGMIIIICVFALFVAAVYKKLREVKRTYMQDSDKTDLDLTKKQ
jgi:Ca2+/Na+ antiporter